VGFGFTAHESLACLILATEAMKAYRVLGVLRANRKSFS